MGEDGEPEGGRTRDFPCWGLCFYPKEKSHCSDRELACGKEERLWNPTLLLQGWNPCFALALRAFGELLTLFVTQFSYQ